jgi:hypothetical protein
VCFYFTSAATSGRLAFLKHIRTGKLSSLLTPPPPTASPDDRKTLQEIYDGQIGVLQFDLDVLSEPAIGPKLLVRPLYEQYFRRHVLPLPLWKKKALLGSPGIGKSMFGIYCIWRLFQENPNCTVYYYLTSPEATYRYRVTITDAVFLDDRWDDPINSPSHETELESVWRIFDSVGNDLAPLPNCRGRGLGISSARDENHKAFSKESCTLT